MVPGVGTAIGGAVGAVAGLVAGLFGGSSGSQTTSDFASQLATKWYQLYLNRQPDAAGLAWWITQIMQDGPAKAWSNFSTSSEPQAHNAIGLAAQYAAQYGGPLVLGPTSAGYTTPTSTPTPSYPLTTGQYPAPPAGYVYAYTPVAGQALPPLVASTLQQASILGSLTPTTLLLGGALLLGAVLLTKHGAKATG